MTPISIPLDLLNNIFLRLPVKSLIRFRCVSKLWSSIITSRHFRNCHLNDHPRLLIAFEDNKGEQLLLVSSPNPNTSLSSSSCCVPYEDLTLLTIEVSKVYNTVQGMICVGGFSNVEICNPTTRQLHTFPEIEFERYPQVLPHPKYIFGYDPVEDIYKVLAVDDFSWRMEHKVIVLGREEAWRDVTCVACPHLPLTSGIYMNGAMYYGASKKDMSKDSIIVRFDVRLETFNIIKVPSNVLPYSHPMWVWWNRTLINYKGKICVVENPQCDGSFRMWVLEDAEKEDWSMYTFHLPKSVAGFNFKVMDTFCTGEICLVPRELSDPFSLYYYNLDRKSMRSVTIEGLPISELNKVRNLSVTVSDHYESLMFLET